MRCIVSLWFPDFPVERFIRGRIKTGRKPPPKTLPFVLVEGASKGLRVVAVNQMGRSFGLMRGMRLADARAQVPDLLSEPHEVDEDMSSLLGLCRWMERYSPWVAPDAPDGILLDVTGIPHLFGGEARMIADMKSRLAQYGFTARSGMGETLGAAWALARYDAKELKHLPVEALRIDGDSAKTLRRLGLKTVGALMAIPRASLARRFRGETIGENVLIRLDELMGVRDEPLNPLNPLTSFMAHRALMEPVIHPDGLETVLNGLVNQLCRTLEGEGRGALRLILKLFRTDGSRANLPAGFSAATHDPRHMLRVLKPRLETVDAGFGIDAMTIEARETGLAKVQQYGFMEDDSTLGLEQLNDRVLNRHEIELLSLDGVESHIPERAEKAHASRSHASGTGDGKRKKRPSLPKAGDAGRNPDEGSSRPLLIFEAPEPAKVIASVPDGPPMRLTWRRVTRRVMKSQGPERVAPEWWRLTQGERPRDYYVVEDEQGRRYWLYREGLYGETGEEQPKWFVHGLSA
ncbi:DNA polymerase Y family protein [Aestuariivirga sp.]|uniref:Y-family DNA polymerase n=1 Tax=Aestuariivirga sp. TaxID=2650926 RepID=UPI00359388E3